MLRALYAFFKSVRLAVVLIIVIIVLSLVATLVPQGRPQQWYEARYSPGILLLVDALQLQELLRLAGLPGPRRAVHREPRLLHRRPLRSTGTDRRRAPLRPRPCAHRSSRPGCGGLATGLGRHEATWALAEGEEAGIGSGYTLHLVSFQYLTYDNGSPRDWISTVNVTPRRDAARLPPFPSRSIIPCG